MGVLNCAKPSLYYEMNLIDYHQKQMLILESIEFS